MIILHGGMCEDLFVIWAEAEPASTSQRRKPREHTPGAPPPTHPFTLARGPFLAHLSTTLPAFPATITSKRIIAWLPSANGLPLLTSSDPAAAPPDWEIMPWQVSGLPLAGDALIALLAHGLRGTPLGENWQVGADLAVWIEAFRLALELVAERRFVPGAEGGSMGLAARWVPVSGGGANDRMLALARQLPGIARALNRTGDLAPAEPARSVMLRFLGLTVDALARAAGPTEIDPVLAQLPFAHMLPTQHYTMHDRWLLALGKPSGHITAYKHEILPFIAQLQDWQYRQALDLGAAFRLCLRLEEPGDPGLAVADGVGRPWRLTLLLQAQADPSLMLRAEDVWHPGGLMDLPPDCTLDDLRLALRVELGKYAIYSATLADLLHDAAPCGVDLDLGAAFTFLTETAGQLEAAGCLVQLPTWWVRSNARRKVKLRAKMRSTDQMMGGNLRSRPLITFDWKVALGDVEISHEELQTLARLKAPLVQVRGQWMQVRGEEIQAALDFWKKQGQRQGTLGDAARLALDDHARQGTLEVDRVEVEGWLAESFDKLRLGNAAMEIIPPPDGLHATLRPYQQRGYAWLRFLSQWGLGACLADDMGLGKTPTTLALIQRDWEAEAPHRRPVLVICPTSVVGNWRREAARFTPDLPVLVHHGGGRRKGDEFAQEAAQYAIVISSYALLHRDRAQLESVQWRGIVLDEAQNIKNAETKQAQAAARLNGDYRIALTGTPVENSVADLWSLMDFLNPGLLGSAKDFKESFFVPIQTRRDPDATARLKRLTGPFLLRRLKTDPAIISDLPDKMEMDVFATLTKEQASLYEAVVRDMEARIDEVEGMARRGLILATLTKLKQVCNHPAHFLRDGSALENRSGKLARLEAMLEEAIAEGDHALIFTQFAEMGALLHGYLPGRLGCETIFLHGQTPALQRNEMIDRFQSDDGPPIFILSLKAGGLGLNLTRANRVFHFDRWWNPAVENQATDRAFRIGQQRAVQVHKFICAGTLEERIAELIASKQELAVQVVGSGEGWLTELSTAQLRDLFALRADAVEV
jgi:superfamily II DNA or RNA helicase